MTEVETGIWDEDRLGLEQLGATFTNLVQSIDEPKVISIEAGFGRGKTFFRERWAQDLRNAGEIVIEIDAQLSDHSGDPVITFLGSLAAALPPEDKETMKKVVKAGKKYGGILGRTALKAILRSGADEVLEAAGDWAKSRADGQEPVESALDELGEDLSKFTTSVIETQIRAERAREKEIPEQLDTLRDALTEAACADRIVIMIDELDRCHPDYALALLEAMKLIFNRPGFVFCLFVNGDQLESLAAHRFGTMSSGERYLDKFIDLRLELKASKEALIEAARQEVLNLPLVTPLGDGPEFDLEKAAEVVEHVLQDHDLTMRQIRRALGHVEIVLRAYRGTPVDTPLLVLLSIDKVRNGAIDTKHYLIRAQITPALAQSKVDSIKGAGSADRDGRTWMLNEWVRENGQGLDELSNEVLGVPSDGRDYFPFYRVLHFFAPNYIPNHEAMLNAARALSVE